MNLENSLRMIGCSADFWCAVSGVSPARWSRILRGTAKLSGQEERELAGIIRELQSLVQDASPHILDFRNVAVVKLLLEKQRQGVRVVSVPVGTDSVEFESEMARVKSDRS
jgi:hypothetical protein